MSDFAYREMAELWEAVFGEQPSVVADPSLTARILVTCLPPTEPLSFKATVDVDATSPISEPPSP